MKINREARPYLWALGLLWGLPGAAVAVGYVLLPDDPDQCQQCVMTARDSVLALAIIGGPFLILLGLVAVAIIWCVNYYNRRNFGR